MPVNDDVSVLTLQVVGPEAERLGPAKRRVFRAVSATIGRAADNDWVLPHALVSGHHAVIDYADGVFYVTDTSTNGTFVNSRENRLVRGQRTAIRTGDSIVIEPFHLEASIESEPDARLQPDVVPEPQPRQGYEVPDDPFRPVDLTGSARSTPIPTGQEDELDPLRLLGVAESPPPAPSVPRAQDLQSSSPLADHYKPPAPVRPVEQPRAPVQLIPDDYDPAAEDSEAAWHAPRAPASPAPPPAPVSPAPPAARRREPRVPAPAREVPEGVDLRALLAGAGLDPADVTVQTAANIGAILRVVVSGVMEVLRARQQIKDEFRMRATRFQPGENNPLKFSANVSDALHNLLVKQNPAYLGPVEAFEDAFDDFRDHQIAMLAGMRTAFETMLADFDPDRLQSQFDRRVKKSLLAGAGQQYWEMYRERAEELARDAEATFRDLFGDRFVKAYEEQLDRLKERGRNK